MQGGLGIIRRQDPLGYDEPSGRGVELVGELVGQPVLDEMEKCRKGSVNRLKWFLREYGHKYAMLWIQIPEEGQLLPAGETEQWSNFALFTKDSCKQFIDFCKMKYDSRDKLSLAKLYHGKCTAGVGIFKPSE